MVYFFIAFSDILIAFYLTSSCCIYSIPTLKRDLLLHFPDEITHALWSPFVWLPNPPILTMQLFYFPGFWDTLGYVLAPEYLELTVSKEREHMTFALFDLAYHSTYDHF